ncbi:vesicle transport protein USE1-like [Tachypleus tridentatus]|uniref:vesicle transport protein USE1-like n=1 Tax=Tachypleus tridentatus TaxID=6853 RepID=UPI003FD04623
MIPKSRLEINFCRLLSRCEELAGQRKQNDWRLEKYVKALEEKLIELKKLNTCWRNELWVHDPPQHLHFTGHQVDC